MRCDAHMLSDPPPTRLITDLIFHSFISGSIRTLLRLRGIESMRHHSHSLAGVDMREWRAVCERERVELGLEALHIKFHLQRL